MNMMMKILYERGNGFAIKEVEREDSKLDVEVIILKDGLFVTSELYNGITSEEKQDLVASYLATVMEIFGVEEVATYSERFRLAKKAMNLGIINDYRIISFKRDSDYSMVEVQLLSNGQFIISTIIEGLTIEKMVKLKEKLNKIKKYQLDIRKQTRPTYPVEIIEMIK